QVKAWSKLTLKPSPLKVIPRIHTTSVQVPMSVILYRYDTSPFSIKIDHVLLLKNI
ncbi:hypothetical protein R3P38DRAFT_2972991, partial [Favolaschia claudopus]